MRAAANNGCIGCFLLSQQLVYLSFGFLLQCDVKEVCKLLYNKIFILLLVILFAVFYLCSSFDEKRKHRLFLNGIGFGISFLIGILIVVYLITGNIVVVNNI